MGVNFGFTESSINTESGKALGEARRAKGEANRGLSGSTDLLGVAKGIAGGVEQYSQYNAKHLQMARTSDAIAAKDDVVTLQLSDVYRKSPSQVRVEMMEGLMKNGEEKKSDAYNSALRGYIKTPYVAEYDKSQEDVNNAILNNVDSDYKAWEEEPSSIPFKDTNGEVVRDSKGNVVYQPKGQAYGSNAASMYVEEVTKNNPQITPKQVNTALMKGELEYNLEQITAVDSRDKFNSILEEQKEDLKKYDNPQFLRTQGASGKEAVNEYKTRIQAAIKAKEKQFKSEAQGKVEDARLSWENTKTLGVPLGDTLKELKYIYRDNEGEYIKASNNVRKEYDKHKKAVEFFTSTDIGEKRPDKYKVTSEWVTDEQLQGEILIEGIEAYDNGKPNRVINILNMNEEKNLKGFGEYMYSDFTQATTSKEINTSISKLLNIAYRPGGASALRRAISDDVVTEMFAVQGLTMTLYPGNAKGARDFYRESASNGVKHGFTRNISLKMESRATTLGDNYNKYYQMMSSLNNINPALAKKQEFVVFDYFNKAHKEYNSPDGSTVRVNTANGPDVLGDTTNPEFAYGLVNKMVRNFIPEGEAYNISTTPNGMVSVKDTYGGSMFTINPKPIAKITEAKELLERQKDAKDTPVASLIIGTTARIARGLKESIVGGISDNIARGNEEDMKEFKRIWSNIKTLFGVKEDTPEEAKEREDFRNRANAYVQSRQPFQADKVDDERKHMYDKYITANGEDEDSKKATDMVFSILEELYTTDHPMPEDMANPPSTEETYRNIEQNRKNKRIVRSIQKVKEAVNSMNKNTNTDNVANKIKKAEGNDYGAYADIKDGAGVSVGAYQFTEKSGMAQQLARSLGFKSIRDKGFKEALSTDAGIKAQDKLYSTYTKEPNRLAKKYGLDENTTGFLIDTNVNGGLQNVVSRALKMKGGLTLDNLKKARKDRYAYLIKKNPKKFKKFEKGWNRRVDEW